MYPDDDNPPDITDDADDTLVRMARGFALPEPPARPEPEPRHGPRHRKPGESRREVSDTKRRIHERIAEFNAAELVRCPAGCGRQVVRSLLAEDDGQLVCPECFALRSKKRAEAIYRAAVPLARRAHEYLERTGRMAGIEAVDKGETP